MKRSIKNTVFQILSIVFQNANIIRTDEPPDLRIIIPAPHIVQACLCVVIIATVAKRVPDTDGAGQAAGGAEQLAPGIVCIAGSLAANRNLADLVPAFMGIRIEIPVQCLVDSRGGAAGSGFVPVLLRHPSQLVIVRRAGMPESLGRPLPVVLVISVICCKRCLRVILEGGHVVVRIVSIPEAGPVRYLRLAEAPQEVIVQSCGSGQGLVLHHRQVPFPVIGVGKELLLCPAGLGLENPRHPVLPIVCAPEDIPVGIGGLQEVPVIWLILIGHHIGSGNGNRAGIAIDIIGEAILESVVSNGGKLVLCVRVCVFCRWPPSMAVDTFVTRSIASYV